MPPIRQDHPDYAIHITTIRDYLGQKGFADFGKWFRGKTGVFCDCGLMSVYPYDFDRYMRRRLK